jgi:hypothetical protein
MTKYLSYEPGPITPRSKHRPAIATIYVRHSRSSFPYALRIEAPTKGEASALQEFVLSKLEALSTEDLAR